MKKSEDLPPSYKEDDKSYLSCKEVMEKGNSPPSYKEDGKSYLSGSLAFGGDQEVTENYLSCKEDDKSYAIVQFSENCRIKFLESLHSLSWEHCCPPNGSFPPLGAHNVNVSDATRPSKLYPLVDDLPKTAARSLNQGSCITSMDFHPIQETLLLVGTNVGDIAIWEVASREKVAHWSFKIWKISQRSLLFQISLVKDPVVSVNRCVWSSDGAFLGVAYSKHVIHVYTYSDANEFQRHLEIYAHVGGVNDLAFAHPNKQLCIITCGDDRTIKVWDAVSGCKKYTFEGHEAPVISVCPHQKENIQFIFSTSIDGRIKNWLYDLLRSKVDSDAPGQCYTTMAYSGDGTRLFSCGTNDEGESYLVEWDESEGRIKRKYVGFQKRSEGIVMFDTAHNRYLAVGDDFQIKLWEMDNTNLLATIDANGGLPECPSLCFNKQGSLLAVTTNDNGIKILANSEGLRLLWLMDSWAKSCASEKSRVSSEGLVSKVQKGQNLVENMEEEGTGSDEAISSFSPFGGEKTSPGSTSEEDSSDRYFNTPETRNLAWIPSEIRKATSAIILEKMVEMSCPPMPEHYISKYSSDACHFWFTKSNQWLLHEKLKKAVKERER